MGTKIPLHTQKIIASELNGDRLVWAGVPDPKRAFRSALPVMLFGIPWTFVTGGFASLALRDLMAGKSGAIPMVLFIVPFVLLGIAMVVSPLWAAREARRSVHVITDQRLLSIVNGGARKVKSARRNRIGPIERVERADGRGDLTIMINITRDSDGDLVRDTMAFRGIENVRDVERLLQAPR